MKTVTKTIDIYKYDELSDEAKENARIWWRSSVDVSEWSEQTYEDASQIGIKIVAFDIDRGNYCEFDDSFDADRTYSDIIKNHGETCDTYIEAKAFEAAKALILKEHKDLTCDTELTYEGDELLNENDLEFKKALQECYLRMLRTDYEYYFSDGNVDENIDINEYDFTVDGERTTEGE